MNNTNILEKKLSAVIDQRNLLIPSVWVPYIEKDKLESELQILSNSNLGQNSTSIIASGKDKRLTQCIVEMLSSAKSTAILCSFLLADESVENAINDAAERGVRIYLMLACETRLDDDNPDDDFGKMCLNQHKSMLKRLAGKVMIRSASHYHAKAVLIDAIGPDQSQAKGLLLTANLTSEALERNEELAVFLSRSEIKGIADVFKWALFENAEHQMLDNTNFQSVQPLGEVEHPSYSDSVLSTTSETNSIRDHALKLINEATSQLIISSFGWQEDHQITDAICEKAKEGVNVVILTRIRPKSMGTLMKLKSAGAKIFGFKWLHAKAIWNDANDAMVMSANLEQHGLDTGFEIGVKLTDNRSSNLKDCLLNFLNKRYSELLLNTMLGKLKGPVKVWDDGNFKDIEIHERITKSLEPIVASCASGLEGQPKFPRSNWLDLPAQEIEYQWSVKAPSLPKGAKELFWEENLFFENKKPDKQGKRERKNKIIKHPYSPKVYTTANADQVIAITQADEIQAAIKLRNKTFSGANIVMLKV